MNRSEYDRQSIRLKGYDYSRPGYYFVTICVKNRVPLFGQVTRDKMILNKYGKIAQDEWSRTGKLRINVEVDEFVIMPNHVHGIIVITDKIENKSALIRNKFYSPSNNLGAIIRGYKSTVTKQINAINGQPGDKIWQRNYYDYIIQNSSELNVIRKYIRLNPGNWDEDSLNAF